MSTSQSQSDNKSFVWNKVNLKSFIPAARDGHCCAVVDRKMYVFGGVASIKQQLAECNELLMFDFGKFNVSFTSVLILKTLVTIGKKFYRNISFYVVNF